jgi:4-amino-4-deoxy-L-arabinose transferase-like glycosyltransferase
VIAFMLRTVNLSTLPAGFFCDEAATGYNAYTLLTKGTDEYGKNFPLFFESFGNWRPAIPFYFTIPFVQLFGLTEFSTRLPSAIIGTLTVLTLFFLAKITTEKSSIGLLASGFLAISPWHIHFSRVGQENIYVPFFISLGITLFFYAEKKQTLLLWLATGFIFGLSLFTYYPAYFLAPFLFGSLLLVRQKNHILKNKRIWLSFCIFILFLSLFLFQAKNTNIFNRAQQLKRYNEGKTVQNILIGSISTYIGHFSPEFLFFKGDIGYHNHFLTRYSVKGMGQLYLFQLPLLFIGIFSLWKRNKSFLLILGILFFCYPVGSTLAPFADGGGPFATRSIIGVIPFTILSAIGAYTLITIWKSSWVRTVIFFFLIIIIELSACFYIYEYFSRYNSYASSYWGWQFGAKETMHYLLSKQQEFDDIFLPDSFNGPDIFLKFYDPKNSCSTKCRIGRPDKFHTANRKQLFAVAVDDERNSPELMSKFNIEKRIFYPNGIPAFIIGTIHPF